jgi:hypothetical protein
LFSSSYIFYRTLAKDTGEPVHTLSCEHSFTPRTRDAKKGASIFPIPAADEVREIKRKAPHLQKKKMRRPLPRKKSYQL